MTVLIALAQNQPAFATESTFGCAAICDEAAPCIMETSGTCVPKRCGEGIEVANGGHAVCQLSNGNMIQPSCPPDSNNYQCLQLERGGPFFVALGIQLIHVCLIMKDAASVIKNRNIYALLMACILFVDTISYLTLSTGHGYFHRCCDGRDIFYARWLSWLVTTPIMIWIACSLGRQDSATYVYLFTSDVAMIVLGYIGSTTCGSDRWIFFVFSILCAVPILHFMCTKFKSIVKLHHLLKFSALTWGLYAPAWLLTTGTGSLCIDQENIIYVLLDILAKATFGIIVKAAMKTKVDATQADAKPTHSDGMLNWVTSRGVAKTTATTTRVPTAHFQ